MKREDFRADWDPRWSSDDDREWDDADNERRDADPPEYEVGQLDCDDWNDHLGTSEMCDDCCNQPATHDLDYTLVCCKCYKEHMENPAPPAPRERFGND